MFFLNVLLIYLLVSSTISQNIWDIQSGFNYDTFDYNNFDDLINDFLSDFNYDYAKKILSDSNFYYGSVKVFYPNYTYYYGSTNDFYSDYYGSYTDYPPYNYNNYYYQDATTHTGATSSPRPSSTTPTEMTWTTDSGTTETYQLISSVPTKVTLTTDSGKRYRNGMFFVKKLYRDLLTGYDTRVRSVQNQSKPVYVYTKFVTLSMVDLDTANQRLSMMAYIRIHWIDEQMVWRPRNYAMRAALRTSLHDLWTPGLVLQKVHLNLFVLLNHFLSLSFSI